MNISRPAVSRMIERLAKQRFVRREEDPADRRRMTILVTPRAQAFLLRLQLVRSAEYAAASSDLSDQTRRRLFEALSKAPQELTKADSATRST
jgi:DNA-binding MarR family transcriptional regulator